MYKEDQRIKYQQKLIEKIHSKDGFLLSEYINANTKVSIKCNKNHIWDTKPYYVTNCDSWCPHCAPNKKLSIVHVNEIISKRGGKLLTTFLNTRTPIEIECNNGHVWKTKPANILNSDSWCPYCTNNVKYDINKMYEIAKIRNGKCLSDEYFSMTKKLLWECNRGHQWLATPNMITSKNTWCPICKESKGEKLIAKILDGFHINYERQKTFELCRGLKNRKLPFDFYLPDFNVCIEFDGRQHFEVVNAFDGENGLERIKITDNIKTLFCNEKSIILLRIRYDEDIIQKLNEMIKNNLL